MALTTTTNRSVRDGRASNDEISPAAVGWSPESARSKSHRHRREGREKRRSERKNRSHSSGSLKDKKRGSSADAKPRHRRHARHKEEEMNSSNHDKDRHVHRGRRPSLPSYRVLLKNNIKLDTEVEDEETHPCDKAEKGKHKHSKDRGHRERDSQRSLSPSVTKSPGARRGRSPRRHRGRSPGTLHRHTRRRNDEGSVQTETANNEESSKRATRTKRAESPGKYCSRALSPGKYRGLSPGKYQPRVAEDIIKRSRSLSADRLKGIDSPGVFKRASLRSMKRGTSGRTLNTQSEHSPKGGPRYLSSRRHPEFEPVVEEEEEAWVRRRKSLGHTLDMTALEKRKPRRSRSKENLMVTQQSRTSLARSPKHLSNGDDFEGRVLVIPQTKQQWRTGVPATKAQSEKVWGTTLNSKEVQDLRERRKPKKTNSNEGLKLAQQSLQNKSPKSRSPKESLSGDLREKRKPRKTRSNEELKLAQQSLLNKSPMTRSPKESQSTIAEDIVVFPHGNATGKTRAQWRTGMAARKTQSERIESPWYSKRKNATFRASADIIEESPVEEKAPEPRKKINNKVSYFEKLASHNNNSFSFFF